MKFLSTGTVLIDLNFVHIHRMGFLMLFLPV